MYTSNSKTNCDTEFWQDLAVVFYLFSIFPDSMPNWYVKQHVHKTVPCLLVESSFKTKFTKQNWLFILVLGKLNSNEVFQQNADKTMDWSRSWQKKQ